MTIAKNQFHLDVRIENMPPMKIDVIDTVTAGLDPRSDLTLSGAKIKNRHLIFTKKEENLALHYLGNTNQTFLNSIPLEEGKVYLLEPGDRIQLTGVEIIIRHEIVHVHEGHHSMKPIVFNSLENLKPESIKEGLIFKDNPTGSMREHKHVQPPMFKAVPKKTIEQQGSFLSLWIVKSYSMVTDFFFTYLFLVTLLPLIFAETYARKILDFLASLIFQTGDHSFLKFFIAWYILSFVQTMVLGTTIGQFLLGLRNKNTATYGKLILFRFKSFIFSIFLLPAQNMVSERLFFKGFRKAGIFFIFVFILASPLLLPSPFNKSVASLKDSDLSVRDIHTKTFVTSSKTLQMSLRTDLSTRYLLLPYVHKSETLRSFQLIDLKTDQSIVIYQSDKILYDDIDKQLEYGNPLYFLLHSVALKDLPLKNRKEVIANTLLLSPFNLKEIAPKFGPFFGSTVLLKKQLLDATASNDTIVKFYAPETPIMFIGSSQQDYFYLLAPDGLDRFVVDSIKRGPMVSVFENDIFTKLLFAPDITLIRNNQQVEILEAQDAFLHGDEHTFLTYYIGVANSLSNAKIIQIDQDLTNKARAAVIKNLETVQKFIKDKNVYKSFDDIKKQLTPMENPGVKR
ncbi:MAG: FHA domain-containing protein [Bacteriovorax sp.]|nr:FHA domain-containing protein [Bacteriovorax sp.]